MILSIERNNMIQSSVIFRYSFLFYLGIGLLTQGISSLHDPAFGGRANKTVKKAKNKNLLYVMKAVRIPEAQ